MAQSTTSRGAPRARPSPPKQLHFFFLHATAAVSSRWLVGVVNIVSIIVSITHLCLGFLRELDKAEIFSLRDRDLGDVAILGAGIPDVRFRRLGRDALDVDRARCELRHGCSVDAALLRCWWSRTIVAVGRKFAGEQKWVGWYTKICAAAASDELRVPPVFSRLRAREACKVTPALAAISLRGRRIGNTNHATRQPCPNAWRQCAAPGTERRRLSAFRKKMLIYFACEAVLARRPNQSLHRKTALSVAPMEPGRLAIYSSRSQMDPRKLQSCLASSLPIGSKSTGKCRMPRSS